MASKTTTTPETVDLVSRAREIASLLATASSIHRDANSPGVVGDSREAALLNRLVSRLADMAVRETEAVMGETVNYE